MGGKSLGSSQVITLPLPPCDPHPHPLSRPFSAGPSRQQVINSLGGAVCAHTCSCYFNFNHTKLQPLYYYIKDTRCQHVVSRAPKSEASMESSSRANAGASQSPRPPGCPSAPRSQRRGWPGTSRPPGSPGCLPGVHGALGGYVGAGAAPLAPDCRLPVTVLALQGGGQG